MRLEASTVARDRGGLGNNPKFFFLQIASFQRLSLYCTLPLLFYLIHLILTAALNKSPKPPIIVDDIHVTELNLGSIPPELEILEIGDLAEDRFRGIFKMSYTGDAFLTLKTRVQANPLNTFLLTRPTFASPVPLAAA
jgi:hypothetical protein